MDNQDSAEETEDAAGGGLQADLLKSYLAFGLRAIRTRKALSLSVGAVVVLLTLAIFAWVPRTYTCTTVLMAVSNPVLEGNMGANPLGGASTLITRHANLEKIVKDTDMARKYGARRPALLKLKDRILAAFFGSPSEEVLHDIIVGTLDSKLSVFIDQSGNLVISVDWTDPKSAAEFAETAREDFLQTRHNAEISAFDEKMSIINDHATRLRTEVENLAQQINSAHEDRARPAGQAAGTGAAAAGPARAQRVFVRSKPAAAEPDVDLPAQKDKLADMKRHLAELEGEQNRRLREEQAKLEEMKLHLTPLHPQVVTEQERVAMLSQVPSDVALLRSEVADLEATIKQRSALAAHPGGVGSGGMAAVSGAAPAGGSQALPAEIVQALESDNTDPALTAQLSGAVVRYGALQDDMRAGRMELDTAQAAFSRRYQVVVPAEVPNKPSKPKLGVILAGGLALALLLALLVPIVAELRRGVLVERWQVQAMQLPVLAELRFPPHSD